MCYYSLKFALSKQKPFPKVSMQLFTELPICDSIRHIEAATGYGNVCVQ